MFGGSTFVVKQFGFSRLVGVCGIVWSRKALLGLLGLYLRCTLGVLCVVVFCYLPFGGGPRKCVGDMFASFEAVVAVSMLVRRFNFQVALGAPPVRMTTGATIHTTEGLKMTVTRRTRPPIMPKLEKTMFEVDESTSGPEGETQLGPKSEVSSANS
ncbi:hypothetical protein POTOM_061739 [Populus tomentosa]|uniref:Transmembrane protein n=1 Tax=Populus tomentosa TaxID=118781 RepID=A0A8X7XSM8_POPTO|nr:hypothetical protein POTOM_061739 [Populus tomentosa]